MAQNDEKVKVNKGENDDLTVENATGNPSEKPTPLPVIAENIPEPLKRVRQWAGWKYENQKGKWKKPPFQTDGVRYAKSDDSTTWTDFETAYNAYRSGIVDGISFAVTEAFGVVGFDFDHCLDDSGNITDPKTDEFVKLLNTYTEKSPSGNGLRLFALSTPQENRHAGNYECYQKAKFLTVTGQRLTEYPADIELRTQKVIQVFEEITKMRKPSDKKSEKSEGSLSDAEIAKRLKKAFASKNGYKIKALYEGNFSGYFGDDQSRADMSLCSSLAFWLDADPAAMDSAFRKSKLFRDKWDEKHGNQTYGEMTIARAIEGCEQTYQDTSKDTRQPASSALIDIGKRADLFFCNDEPYATVSVNGHFETHAINSRSFKDYLNGVYYDENGCAANKDSISQACDTLRAIARKNGEKPVFTRIAGMGDAIYVDLCNSDYEVVRITASGWEITKEPSVRFIRGAGAESLPRPERTGTGFADLKRLMNCKEDEDFCMLTAFLVGCFSFGAPYPILCLQGAPGTGKSTKTVMIKRLTDPNQADHRGTPESVRDLMISARQQHVLAYDNISGLTQWLSDAFCRLSTGAGFSKRAHYSDAEEVIFKAKRPIVLNGIEDIHAQKHDLSSRAISVVFDLIPEESKLEEGVIWAEFERARPGILGSLFDAVSESLKNLNRVVLTQKNVRMLDFAKFVIAAESALPFDRGFFMKSYIENADRAAAAAIENDDVADAIRTLMNDREMWEGPAKELLEKLTEITGENAKLPKRPNQLSGKIRRSIPSLKKAGIQIDVCSKRWGEKKIPMTIFLINLIHNCKESIGYIGYTSLCTDEDSKKTDSYSVADHVADQPDVADQHRLRMMSVADHVADQKSGVADQKNDVSDIKHNKIKGYSCVADEVDKSGNIRGSDYFADQHRQPESGVADKCQGKSFIPLSD